MSYKIVKRPTAWWPVTISGPGEDGSIVEQAFELRFLVFKVPELTDWLAQFADVVAAENDPIGKDLPQLYAQLIAQIALDWRGVLSENDEAVKWDVPAGWAERFAADRAILNRLLADLAAAIPDTREAYGASRAIDSLEFQPLDAPNLRSLMAEGGMFRAVYDAFRDCLAGRRETREGN